MKNQNTPSTSTATTSRLDTNKFVSPRYKDLLACFKYSASGDLPAENNCLGKASNGLVYFYCKAVKVAVQNADGKVVDLGRNPYEWFCYSVAKRWAENRDFLPSYALDAVHQEEHRAVVSQTLFESLEKGIDLAEIPQRCFTALDDSIKARKQSTHKTMPREEHQWSAQRAFVATLFTGDLSSVGGNKRDMRANSKYGGLSIEDRESLKRLKVLFDKVKEEHEYARSRSWLCAQCYALNMPTEDAIKIIYADEIAKSQGKSERTIKKVIKACRTKYSTHANEVFNWLLDEVEKSPVGYEKWTSVMLRIKAENAVDETARDFRLDDEVVKRLRDMVITNPDEVINACDLIKQTRKPVTAEQ